MASNSLPLQTVSVISPSCPPDHVVVPGSQLPVVRDCAGVQSTLIQVRSRGEPIPSLQTWLVDTCTSTGFTAGPRILHTRTTTPNPANSSEKRRHIWPPLQALLPCDNTELRINHYAKFIPADSFFIQLEVARYRQAVSISLEPVPDLVYVSRR